MLTLLTSGGKTVISEKMEALGRHRSVIREIFEYGRVRRAEIGAENVFDFSLGNPSLPAPREVGETLTALLRNTDPAVLHGYTSAQGDAGVREAIADYLRKTHGAEVDDSLIYMTVGAAAALTVTLHALLADGGGEEVITVAPYFPEYKVFCEAAGARLVPVAARAADLQPDIEAIARALTPRTKAIILNSPNNPTGVVFREEGLRALAAVLDEAARRFGHPIYIIADEPYRELVYDGIEVPFIPNLYADTVVCYSFSKSLSLPGERIGYIAVSPRAENAEAIYAAVLGAGRALGFVCAPALFQHMVPACLGKTADIGIYRKNRDRLLAALTEYGYDCVHPDGAFYLFVRSMEEDACRFAERAKKQELLLVPSDDFGYPGYVRIAYCVTPEQIERSLPAFRALAEEYQKGEDNG